MNQTETRERSVATRVGIEARGSVLESALWHANVINANPICLECRTRRSIRTEWVGSTLLALCSKCKGSNQTASAYGAAVRSLRAEARARMRALGII